ncbi:hypothetical protein PR202_gb14928 [Eleusine coracana subsp. coracana]|uniref:Uncharacterized protein n=1 Tax=Eleusine coracana subsp. coracana TaxID=191504 RepID=A0AAV5EWN9_ELECO|nr:hypothetical protein PR202_gb14928 [Eleusine coracana subsp. coracana]
MDKVGRVCHIYLTPTHAMLLHNLLGATASGADGSGPQCVAQFAKDLLFRDYYLSSRNGNRIAFAVDIALLHRALRSVLAVHAQSPAIRRRPSRHSVGFVQTLVQVPDLPQLQSLVDRLKNVGDLLTVAVTQYGDLHLQVSTSLVTVGSEFQRLRVLGDRGKLWN